MNELERLSDKEVLASQKGMDRRVAGWKLGDLRIYLLYSQIFRYYWFRIETPEGELIKKNELHEHYSSYERAMAKIADVIEELTGNKEVAEEFREPLKIKQKEDARSKHLLELYENTEAYQKFEKYFYNVQIRQGLLIGDNGAVGLVLDPDAKLLEGFKQPNYTFTVKVTPKSRAKFKPYGRNIIINNEFYNAKRLYDLLMILGTKKLITFTQNDKGILMIQNTDNERLLTSIYLALLLAPLSKIEMDAEEIIEALPIDKFLGTGRLWRKCDVINMLEETLKLSREKLIELAKEFQEQAEEKDYYRTKEDKERYVNGELGHRGHTSNYLSLKEKLARLSGAKVDHAELMKPYLENKDMWKDGELLI